MFLKRLDVFGFKSFADRTEIEFGSGVTAVVGPNGSGKSNVADAVKWALGEQSAKSLRGARMEDVIFSGSQTRKPLNLCEVSLTFDNSDGLLPVDFAEVTVTRRYYRSGESEYLLNRQACRLRDITELLMDTGVGREAYSMIGQGQIDEILSNRPEDRRGIFEEAAGIVKFKARRREAEKKLAEAEEHHGRVRDILAELDGQMGPLQERAETARRYQALEQQATDLHIALLAHEIGDLLARRDEAERQADSARAALSAIGERAQAVERQVAQWRAQADLAERQIADTQTALLAATASVEQFEAERRLSFERHEHALAGQEEAHLALQRLQRELAELEAERGVLEQRAVDLRREHQAVQSELERRQNSEATRQMAAQCKAEIEQARAELIEVMRAQAAGRNELRNLAQRLEHAQREAERERADAAAQGERVGELEAQRQEAVRLMAAAQAAGEQASADIRAAQERVATVGRAAEAKTHELQALERTRLATHTRLTALQDMQRDLDGFAAGPRAVLRAARDGKLGGIRGAVADVVDVPDKWRLAVETALGGALQNIIVATEASARQAIEFLRRAQAGRATFLPLETIRGRRMPPHEVQMVKSASGFVGVAAELATVEDSLRPILDSLLGHVLVVETLPDANRIARVLQHRVRIVTLAGDVVNPGGSMTGGAVGRKGAAILGRAQEIAALAARERELGVQADAVKAEQDSLARGLDEARADAAAVQARLALCARELQAAEAREAALCSAGERAQLQRDALLRAVEQHEAEARRSRAGLDAMRGEVDGFAAQIATFEGRIAAAQENLQRIEEEAQSRGDELTELRVLAAQREEAARGADDALRRVGERVAGVRREIERIHGERANLHERLARFRADLERYAAQGKEAGALRDELKDALETLRAQREDSAAILGEGERTRASVRDEERAASERLRANETVCARAEAEVEGKMDTLRERYGVGLELAQQNHALLTPPAEARAQWAACKRELESFGEVSLGAIEECARLGERHRFLHGEERDLDEARGQLQTLLDDMDAEMRRRFHATFEDVRGHFCAVFGRLFDGGRADIRLSGEDALTAGIEIVAEPPGKKMQSLSLLSGGERALTALALLFAILHVKPVPFCILDEVEAALDEANVARFADYLRVFAGTTQFVLITHRRGTMETADVLYGVTVHDSGASRLVSVRVADDEVATA